MMRQTIDRSKLWIVSHYPGLLVCALIALSATFLAEHYGGPQLLYALLIGLSFHFLMKNPQVKPGVDFCGRTVLRLGVALLGARITLGQVAQLGIGSAILIICAVACTVAFGVLLARWLDRERDEGLLSGGAVAICGASAAMAVASVLPQTPRNERFTLLTVVGVTVLSTVAMIVYPFALKWLVASPQASGLFLGGTIHDVAQVVAAGMMLGPQAGDTATVVKLFRVMLLTPVVVVIAMLYRRQMAAAAADAAAAVAADGNKPPSAPASVPLIPGFLLAFIVLMLLASTQVLPKIWVETASQASRCCLVAAIAAAGIKTSFEELLKLGWQPVLMLVTETLFIALFVAAGMMLMA
ncbi:MAG: YeiH family protein [Brachymonas sp.]